MLAPDSWQQEHLVGMCVEHLRNKKAGSKVGVKLKGRVEFWQTKYREGKEAR